MTMLDRMRRHRNWLKWSLALVVVAFVAPVHPRYVPRLRHAAASNAAVANVDGRRNHRRRVPPGLPAPDAAVPPGVRRQHRRAPPQAARHRPAHRPADDRGGGLAGRSQAARARRQRRRGPPAHPGDPGVPGERPVHRHRSLSADAADAGARRPRKRVRGPGPPQHHDRKTPGRGHRLDHRRPTSTSRPSSRSATRRSKFAVVSFPADKFREGVAVSDAEVARWFEEHKNEYNVPEKRKVPLRADRRAGPSRARPGLAAGHPAVLQRQRAAVLARPSRSAPATSF